MMGLFRKRSNSSSNSTKLKRNHKAAVSPPILPVPPVTSEIPRSSFVGPNNHNGGYSNYPATDGSVVNSIGNDGGSTPISHLSAQTQLHARSTAPSSVDAMSAVGGNKAVVPVPIDNGQNAGPNNDYFNSDHHQRISRTSMSDSELDSRQSSVTVTSFHPGMAQTREQEAPAPVVPNNPSTTTLPQEWADRDPSINTRYTHSPTPSESASLQSSVIFPSHPQTSTPERKGYNNRHGPPNQPPNRGTSQQYHPNSASQRLPPPVTPRNSSFRHNQPRMPSLPEHQHSPSNSHRSRTPGLPGPPGPPRDRRSQIPATPGPRALAISFTQNQMKCHIYHKSLLPMKNFHHHLPCMVCRRSCTEGMQYCTWCSLRVCRDCGARVKKDWDGDISRGWGGVEPAVSEFGPEYLKADAKMVAGWSAQSPPIPARNAVNQLVWPPRSNTERVCSLLGIVYRPKTAPLPNTSASFQTPSGTFSHHPDFSFESALDLESAASTVSPPSPVTPPAFGGTGLAMGMQNGPDGANYGYGSTYDLSPEIASDSTPELLHPRPTPYSSNSILSEKTDSKRSRAYSFDNMGLYQTNTQQSNTTVGKNSVVRPVIGADVSGKRDILADVAKAQEKKKSKGLKGFFSKK